MEKKLIAVSKKVGYIGTIIEYDGKTVKIYDDNDGSYEKLTLKDLEKLGAIIEIE